MRLKFTKMHGAGQRFRRSGRPCPAHGADPRADADGSPTAISASAATRCWWSSRRRHADTISTTASSMPTAARWSNAATARAASCATCRTKASPPSARSASRPRGGVIVPRARGRRPGHRGHGRAASSSPRASRSRRAARAARAIRSTVDGRGGRGRARYPWATRTRCRSWRTSSARRSRPRAR